MDGAEAGACSGRSILCVYVRTWTRPGDRVRRENHPAAHRPPYPLPAGGCRQRLNKRVNPVVRIRLVVRAGVDDIAFHDEDGDVAV